MKIKIIKQIEVDELMSKSSEYAINILTELDEKFSEDVHFGHKVETKIFGLFLEICEEKGIEVNNLD